MFAGILIGLAATELFIYVSNIKKLQLNMGDSIPPAVGKSFSVLIPFILVMTLFGIISAVLNNVFHTNLISIITTMIQEPLRGVTTGLFGCVLNGSILEPLLMINMTQCMAAYAAGEAIPNIINAAFVPTFGMMGGSGSAIGIIIGYAATALNFINECVVYIPWTTPPLLSGYLATSGDFRAVIVQLIIIAIGVVLYLPFVKINDKLMEKTASDNN